LRLMKGKNKKIKKKKNNISGHGTPYLGIVLNSWRLGDASTNAPRQTTGAKEKRGKENEKEKKGKAKNSKKPDPC